MKHGEAEEQVLNLRLEPQTMALVPNHDPYFPHFSKHKFSTCPLTSLYLNHKLAQERATWKINISVQKVLVQLALCSPQHTSAGSGVMPILVSYPMLDSLIHLSLFAKSFYFCTNDFETAGIVLAKNLKSQISIKRKKRATPDKSSGLLNAEFSLTLENQHEFLKPPIALKKKNTAYKSCNEH